MNTNTEHGGLSAAEFIDQYTPTQWLAEDVIPVGSVSTMIGGSGTGKSFIALDLASSIATGRPWCGRRVQKAPVVYFCGEGVNDFRLRLIAWQDEHTKYSRGQLALLTEPMRLHVAGEAEKLGDRIQSMIDDGTLSGPPGAVFLDTLSMACQGTDLSETDATQLFGGMQKHIQARYGSAVVIIHHEGWGSAKGRARGSYQFFASPDRQYIIERMTDASGTRMRQDKFKDGGGLLVPLYFELVSGTFEERPDLVDSLGRPEPRRFIRPAEGKASPQTVEEALTPVRLELLRAIGTLVDEVGVNEAHKLTADQIRQRAAEMTDKDPDAFNVSRDLRSAFGQLVKHGFIPGRGDLTGMSAGDFVRIFVDADLLPESVASFDDIRF